MGRKRNPKSQENHPQNHDFLQIQLRHISGNASQINGVLVSSQGTTKPLKWCVTLSLTHPTCLMYMNVCTISALQTLPILGILIKITGPVFREQTGAHVPMKRRIRPVPNALHMAMFYRVDIAIFQMTPMVTLVAYGMLPKTPLPDAALATLDA